MEFKEILATCYGLNGIGFPMNRHLPPAYCGHIPNKDEHLTEEAPVTYEQLDALVEEGLIWLSEYRGYSNALLTYEGRKKYLELKGWDRSKWYYANSACCSKALPVACVCTFRTTCSDHGSQCHGTHD